MWVCVGMRAFVRGVYVCVFVCEGDRVIVLQGANLSTGQKKHKGKKGDPGASKDTDGSVDFAVGSFDAGSGDLELAVVKELKKETKEGGVVGGAPSGLVSDQARSNRCVPRVQEHSAAAAGWTSLSGAELGAQSSGPKRWFLSCNVCVSVCEYVFLFVRYSGPAVSTPSPARSPSLSSLSLSPSSSSALAGRWQG